MLDQPRILAAITCAFKHRCEVISANRRRSGKLRLYVVARRNCITSALHGALRRRLCMGLMLILTSYPHHRSTMFKASNRLNLICLTGQCRRETMVEPDEVSAILRLYELGWGAKRIARELGIS
jgi:hypothetical protein